MRVEATYVVFGFIYKSPDCQVFNEQCGINAEKDIPTFPSVALRAASTLFPVAVSMRLVSVPETEWNVGAVTAVVVSGTPTRDLCQSTTPMSDSWRA